jgi:Ca2+/Na+ antiporter
MQHIKSLAAMLMAYFILIIWRDLYAFSCIILIIPLIITSIMMMGLFQFAAKKRLCLATCYFQSTSLLYKIFTGKLFVFLRALLTALLLTLVLLTQVVLWEWKVLIILFINVFLLYGLYLFILHSLAHSIHAKMRFVIAKNWTVTLNLLIMILVLAGVQYYSLIPDYLDASLTQTLNNATTHLFSECNIVHYLLQIGAEKDAFSWWLMMTGNEWISDQVISGMVWTVFLLSGGLAIWGYNRYLIEVADLLFIKEENYEITSRDEQ